MKEYSKKILVSLLILGMVASAMIWFFRHINDEKVPHNIDLFTLLLPGTESIVCINRPDLFGDILKTDIADTLFSPYLSDHSISLIKRLPANQRWIIALNKRESLLCTTVTKHELNIITRSVFALSSPFPAKEETLVGNIKGHFYALNKNKFFGYYEYKGVLVAAYSRKLLEKTALQQIAKEQKKETTILPWLEASRKLNRLVPVNLLFSTDSLQLSVTVDSITSPIPNRWLAADIYFEKDKLCCFGNTTEAGLIDSLYTQLSDTISARIETQWPAIHATTTVEKDNGLLYYTVCGSLSVSNTNPSNE